MKFNPNTIYSTYGPWSVSNVTFSRDVTHSNTEEVQSIAKKAATAKLAEIVDNAPEDLDTLNELAEQIQELKNDHSLSAYMTTASANATFQPIGDYATTADLDDYAKTADLPDVSGFVTTTTANETFQPKGEYLVASDLDDYAKTADLPDVSGFVTTTTANETFQPKGEYLVASDLDDYATKEELENKVDQDTVYDDSELRAKYDALRDYVYEYIAVTDELATPLNAGKVEEDFLTTNNVEITRGTLGDVTIPEMSSSATLTAPMEDGATVTLSTPNKSFTLNNTSDDPVSVEVDAPYYDNSTSNTTMYLQGEYDTITVENANISKASNREAPIVHDIIINNNVDENVDEPKLKSSTISATFTGDSENPSTVTTDNVPTLTITNYNPSVDENENPVTPPSLNINAPNTTVTLNSSWDEVNATVSDNTLIVSGTAHINKLSCNNQVIVRVAAEDRIAGVISNIVEGTNVDYTKIDVNNDNATKLTSTAECTLQGDITRTYGLSFGVLSNDKPVWKLNNHTFTVEKERVGLVLLRGSATLDIYGPGTLVSADYCVWTANAANIVNVYGGDFIGNAHALYAEAGTINVYGGTFRVTSEDTGFVINCRDANYQNGSAHMNVYGGTFYDFDPSNNRAEGPNTNYVAPGYESVESTVEIDGVVHHLFTVQPVS